VSKSKTSLQIHCLKLLNSYQVSMADPGSCNKSAEALSLKSR